MIGKLLDNLISVFSPQAGIKRAQARRLMRAYSGAETNRLNANKRPKNQSADGEMAGPFGAEQMRAWARMLVRDNAWAWGVVDTIVSSVVGNGITIESAYETPEGSDIEGINEARDAVWNQWCEACEINGQYSFTEIQQMVQREMVEAGECLIHMVTVPTEYRGIHRPVPLALELIEADRLALDKDTYSLGRREGLRIVRGVELDELGRPIAYWIYPDHPNAPHVARQAPVRIEARNILHLYRRDRIGQTRGISWFAPVISWMRDLGVYVDNELQASAVASCFGVAIKSDSTPTGLLPPSVDGVTDTSDANGNQYQYIEPGMVMHLRPNESVESFNPTRPNSASEAWIRLMLRGISVGTGLSYEIVARDYSQTNYSSNRASQLEDRRRFRRWQRYLINHLNQPIWDRFCEAAAVVGRAEFPTMSELLTNRRKFAACEHRPPTWEWVDPQAEQTSSENSIKAMQATYADELGAKGLNWRHVFYQRAKEEALLQKLGLVSPSAAVAADANKSNAAAASDTATADSKPAGTGEMANMSRLQFKRNRKAITDILGDYIAGAISETQAKVLLGGLGLAEESVAALIADAADGTVDSMPEDATA